MAKNEDVLHVILSDPHSGSNNAWFLERQWSGLNGMTHYPTSAQIRINDHAKKFAEYVKSKKQRKIIVVNGDAIDGDHHNSGDVCTTNELEQSEIHIEIMQTWLKRAGYDKRRDLLYYVKGTQVHTGDWEDYIGKELGAVKDGVFGAWDILELTTNGVLSYFVHHGAGAGAGATEGNAAKNMMRVMQIDAQKDGRATPDIIYTGHVHNPTYQTHSYRFNGYDFKTMHYIITPSWQAKTRYAWKAAPLARNIIGGVTHEIKADGTVTIPNFFIMR